ncbi:MAG: hypothetical protein KGS61_18730 [Verrucomicrobia bacterium]|nr:hypothetical protein [Verrucomicrobiota bacterium]
MALVSVLISALLKPGYLASVFLFYGTPVVYFALRLRSWRQILRGLFFAGTATLPFTIVVDYIGTVSGVWSVPRSAFADRLFGIIPVEDFLWMFLGICSIILMYEAQSKASGREIIGRRMKSFLLVASFGLNIFLILIATRQTALFIWPGRYAYLALGCTFFLIPAVLYFWHFPRVFTRCIPTVGYFFILTVVFELTATSLGEWNFGGLYLLPPFTLFGIGSVPYEELAFVGIVGPLAAIALFEFFDNSPPLLRRG